MSKLFSKLSLSSKDKNATPETSKVSSSSTTPASTSSAAPQQDSSANMSSSTAAPTSTGPSVSQSTTQSKGPTAKIAVIIWSLYGHIASLTEPIVEGAKATGAEVEVFQIAETLSDEVIGKMHGNKSAIAHYPVIKPDDLKRFDGFIFGFPTRYGRTPSQVSAFFDQTGGLWATGALVGKFATIFTSTASLHGGQETTALTTLPFFIHHGISYVPLGYITPELQALDEVQGGSAYGASTVAGGDGSRQPTKNDLTVAKVHGGHFAKIVNQFVRGAQAS